VTWPDADAALQAPLLGVRSSGIDPKAINGSLDASLEGKHAVVVGPGFGHGDEARIAVEDLLAAYQGPIVVDADALNALAGHRRALARPALARLGPGRVLTPHPGEMSRLTGRPVPEIQGDRREAALRAAAEWGAVVVLKGARTVVAEPGGRFSEDPHEVPALATGGTGDVLSGIIGGLLAQGAEPFSAAVTGVYVHGEAGLRIQRRQGTSGLLASDLLAEIPGVMNQLREGGL